MSLIEKHAQYVSITNGVIITDTFCNPLWVQQNEIGTRKKYTGKVGKRIPKRYTLTG